jgi:anti-anti-sigma regulatory factor
LDNLPLTDAVERRQAKVFQIFLIGWIILASLGVPGTFLLGGSGDQAPPPESLPPIMLVILPLLIMASLLLWLTPVSALVLLRRGRFRLAVGVATLGLLLSHTMATFTLGVGGGAVMVVFQIPIALAGLLAGRRLLWGVTSFSIAIVIVVGILQNQSPPLAGFFIAMANAASTPAARSAELANEVMAIGFFVAITLLIALLLDRFGSTLREALLTSLEREAELKDIRASLEANVAERTSELQAALSDVQTRAEEQGALLVEIEQQRAMIKDLSVPVIPISADTLVMPLVGALDSTRLRQLQEQSLQALERTSARRLLLDITGVPVVDSQVAQGLLMTVRSARLLGSEVTLVGIRPEVAQTIVGLGIDLRDVSTFSDLQSALARVTA